MDYLFIFFLIASFSTCYGYQKLTCNELTNDTNIENATVSFDVCTALYDSCISVVDADYNQLEKSLKYAQFNPSFKTIVLIHGFTNKFDWMQKMAQKWLESTPQVNIITVKWPNYYNKVFAYRKAALLSESVAYETAQFLMKLYWMYGNELNKSFYFVGHSLGAHVAGQAARLLNKVGVEVQRLTALDPAHPCFEDETASLRLRDTDAKFVDVIHTNGQPGVDNPNFGSHEKLGQVDFYVNGGNKQPECEQEQVELTEESIKGKHKFHVLFSGIFGCDKIYDNPELKDLRKFIIDFINKEAGQILPRLSMADLRNLISLAVVKITEVDMADVLQEAVCQNSFCNHGSAINYFMDTLDQNAEKKWASSVGWPVINTNGTVSNYQKCQNRKCKENQENCIEMGINTDKYFAAEGPFYVDTTDEVIDCDKECYAK